MAIKVSELLQSNTDLSSDTTPELGGPLDTNGYPIENGTDPVIISGPAGLEMPVGTTAQRPSIPANGIIRYNTDTNSLEGYFSDNWVSEFAPISKQLFVQQNPGAGQYSSIAAACSAIVDATSDNPWEILVAPGTYYEPEIVVPPWVQISGLEEYGVIVRAATPAQNVFVLSSGSTLSFMQVYDAGPGYAGVVAKNLELEFALCHKVGVYNCDIGFDFDASTVATTVYLEYCDTTNRGTAGMRITSANGFPMYANIQNVFAFGDDTGNPTYGIFVSGSDTTLDVTSLGLNGNLDVKTGTGLYIQDGAQVFIKAGSSFGWDTGVSVSDAGVAPNVNLLAITLGGNNSEDFISLHPGTTGILTGAARSDFVDTSASPMFTLAYSDQETNKTIQTGDLLMGTTGATLTNVTSLIIDTPAVGLLNGGVMTTPGGTVIDVSAGSGYLRKDGLMTLISWGNLSISLTAGTQPYLFIDQFGALQQSTSVPNYITNVVLGRIGLNETQIISIGSLSVNIENYGNRLENYLRDAVGPIFVSGSIVTENAVTPRAVDVTAGRWYYGSQQRTPSSKIAPSVTIPYHVAGVLTFSASTQIPNTSYDNGTNLVPLTAGYFTKHVLYQSSDGTYQAYLLAYGREEYATLDDAIAAPLPTPFIDPGPTPKISALVVQEGLNSFASILDVRPIFGGKTAGSTSGTNIHGDLLGLDADDHTQYLLVDGSRGMSGALNMGTFNITNTGTINSVTIQTHGARHLPNGADPLTTAVATGLNLSSTNTVGINNSFARSDHTHQITGVQPVDATLTALSAYNTDGFLTQTAANTFVGRTLTGTTNRISIIDGNGVSGNPVIDISANPVLPGTASVTVPSGTAAQRSVSPVNGMLRYNTDNNRIEAYQNSVWVNYTDALYLPGSTYKTIQDFIDIIGSRGTFSGGLFADNGNGTISVTGGTGMIHPVDDTLSPLYFLDFPTTASVTLTDNALNNIFIDYNSGTPQIVAISAPDFSANKIIIGQVYRSGTTLTLNNYTRLKLDNSFVGIINRFQTVTPFQHESGAMLSESGTRNFAITAGAFWEGIDRLVSAAKDTSTGDTFTYWYRSAPTTWVSVPGQTQINNTQYNNPSTGLATLSNNAYGIHWVYAGTDGTLNVVYGTTNTNLANSQDAQPPATPPNTLATAALIGRIIILKGASSFTEVQSAFSVVFTGGSTSVHNELGGLQGGSGSEYYHLTATQNTTVSAIDLTGNGIISKTGTGTFANRTITGTVNRITLADGAGASGNPTIDIASTYVGQTSITTLGTIATGSWNATTIPVIKGGTGLTASGTANQILGVNVGGTALEYKTVSQGTGIIVTAGANSIAIANTGVLSTTGTANQITTSATTGAVTLSISDNPIIPGTASVTLPIGTTGQRSVSPVNGMIRYNSTTGYPEFYNVAWVQLAGVVDKSVANQVQSGTVSSNLVSYSVPGNLLNTAGLLKVTLAGIWNNTSGANRTSSWTITYGGTTLWAGTTGNMPTAQTVAWNLEFVVKANNSNSSQTMSGVFNIGAPGAATTGTGSIANATNAPFVAAPISGTASVNSATAQTLVVTCVQNGVTTTITKYYHTIEVL